MKLALQFADMSRNKSELWQLGVDRIAEYVDHWNGN